MVLLWLLITEMGEPVEITFRVENECWSDSCRCLKASSLHSTFTVECYLWRTRDTHDHYTD